MKKIGAVVNLHKNCCVAERLNTLRANGFACCQLVIWDTSLYTDEMAEAIRAAVAESGIEVSTLWCGWSGPTEWNFTGGPVTLGLVPATYRAARAEELIAGAHFAAKIGVSRMATHVGFLPENMTDPAFPEVIAVLRYVIGACKQLGIHFLFETGQETPVTLLRVIEELGMDNVGINMDTANLILYGKGNSADAISVFGKYVMDTHIKDGFYPTCGRELGREVKVGEGLANLPEVMRRLDAVGYQGNYIIEREIEGEQQTKDMCETRDLLLSLLKKEETGC